MQADGLRQITRLTINISVAKVPTITVQSKYHEILILFKTQLSTAAQELHDK
jgi:hypothetical protein